eukprot:Polyplicarium_translucidae@DN133_c0_g1_i1.p1
MGGGQAVETKSAPPGVAYSQAIAIPQASGKLVYVSGQLGLKDGDLVEGTAPQLKQALVNMAAILESAGGKLAHVVDLTLLITDMDDYAAVNEVYLSVFTEKPLPARACYAVKGLPKGALVEIKATAFVPS